MRGFHEAEDTENGHIYKWKPAAFKVTTVIWECLISMSAKAWKHKRCELMQKRVEKQEALIFSFSQLADVYGSIVSLSNTTLAEFYQICNKSVTDIFHWFDIKWPFIRKLYKNPPFTTCPMNKYEWHSINWPQSQLSVPRKLWVDSTRHGKSLPVKLWNHLIHVCTKTQRLI